MIKNKHKLDLSQNLNKTALLLRMWDKYEPHLNNLKNEGKDEIQR